MSPYLLHSVGPRINSNSNTLEEIKASEGPITFDGIYESVFIHSDLLRNRDVILFACGNHVGRWNDFDRDNLPNFKLERFLDWNEIVMLCTETGASLGWHSWSHRDLTLLSDDEVREELKAPFYMKHFAYPFGNVDLRVARLVKEAGYEDAYSVCQGDNSQFQKKRRYLNW